MKVSFRYTVMSAMSKKCKLRDYFDYWEVTDLESAIKENRDLETSSASINISGYDKKKTITFLELIKECGASQKTIFAVNLWLNNLSNPNDAVITSLQNFQKLCDNVVSKSSLRWIWNLNPDGCLVPYYVKEIKYRSGNREEAACVCISCEAQNMSTDRWSSDNKLTIQTETKYIYFHRSNIGDLTENELLESYFDNDDNDDDEEIKTKKKPIKKEGFTLSKILSDKGVFLTSDEIYNDYKRQILDFQSVIKKIGKVYCSDSVAYTVNDGNNGYSSWKNINIDDKISKLVVDDIKSIVFDSSKPLHPYVLTYNLNNYCYCIVHVDKITEYQYDDKIVDKLILSHGKKKLLKAIISNQNNFSDVVAGKSGGIVILASGKAGLGKTLTAEAYSELMKKPLYCIQSSQLGVEVVEIEKRLSKILYRAEKWNAVLLIDEADTYVQQRGENIVQNCIVGIFLRLLEYFNGVLFLTTNRHEIIDDAIMSRVTAHIKYEYPDKEESTLLWKVLCNNFGIEISDIQIDKIFQHYETFSGRDIRNFLKMFTKTSDAKTITLDCIKELEDFLPFIKTRNFLPI